ncbi:MAG: peptidoglycan D,D-transpeptidase FtsI family protein [Acidimicrobiales bacterium]
MTIAAPPARRQRERERDRRPAAGLKRQPGSPVRRRQPVRPVQPVRSGRARGRRGAVPRVLPGRVRAIRVLLVVLSVVVVARLVQVQFLHSGRYQEEASQELMQPVALPALRGGIYDRDGRVLAMSLPTQMVLADDFQIRHPATEAAALAPLVGMGAAQLVPLLDRRSGYVPIARHLSSTRAAKVAALAFPGITLVEDPERVDPNGALASPVIGMVNGSGKGAGGLEYQYDHHLAGKAGSETLLASPSGVALPGSPVARRLPAVAGTGLELTLDEPLQYTAEQALASEIAASHAVGGEVAVMDVRTGQILAMANLVATHPAPAATGTPLAPVTGPVVIGPTGPVSEAPSNLAVTQDYEPGSVFKLVTFSAALAGRTISPGTVFTVPDQRVLDGSTFHDAEPHPTEQMTATQILAQSSNIGTSEIAQKIGETRLLDQVAALGFDGRAGLRFPGGSDSLLVGPSQWAPTDFVSLAIGQVDAVTALQVLDAYNTVAHGGTFVGPSLVRATVGADGSVRSAARGARHRAMPASTAAELTGMLQQVVSTGTGAAAAVPGYLVAGKTGTAQIPSTGQAGYEPGAFEATFVGFAPANHPVLSAIVVLDRPQPIYGGAVAAPVFSKVMGYALHRYDIPTSPGLYAKPQAQATATAAQLVQDAT